MSGEAVAEINRRSLLVQVALLTGASLVVDACTAPGPRRLPGTPVASPFIAFGYINKRPDITIEEMIDRYENGHAIEGAKGIERDFSRYSRNYVMGFSGEAPAFDCINEFIPPAGFPRDRVCGGTIDPNWISVVSGQVTEILLHGPAWRYQPGPVHKRGYILRTGSVNGAARDDALLSFARAAARALAPYADRILLEIQGPVQDTFRCTDMPQALEAILMVWPKGKDMLPDMLPGSGNVSVPTVVRLLNYSSDVPVGKRAS